MKIAMVITSYHPIVGGAEKQVAQLSKRLVAAGNEVHIVTRRWPGLEARAEIDGVHIHRVGGGDIKGISAASFGLAAVARLFRLAPDVIHCHSLFTPALAGALAKRLFGIPVMAKPMCGDEASSIARKRFGQRRLDEFARTMERFIAVSGEIDRELQGLGIPKDKIRFIPNGVDLERFQPESSATARESLRARLGLPEGVLFLFAGRIATQKRLPMLLEQWPRVLATAPDAKLLVAGANRNTSATETADGADEGVPESLLKQPGVHLLGHVDDMAPLYKAVDVFVLPSAREGLSNAMLEACASGLPTVAANIGGAEDFVQHGQNGYLYDVDSIDQLGDGMIAFANSETYRTAVGAAARETVAKTYDIDVTARRIIDQYIELTGQSFGDETEAEDPLTP